MPTEGALILYGNGGSLGNFRFFADDLATQLARKFDRSRIKISYANRGSNLLRELTSHDRGRWLIKELHVFSHSIGGGLMLGYGDTAIGTLRQSVVTAADGTYRPATYDRVVVAEVGAVLTDHFLAAPFSSSRSAASAAFSAGASIRLWGCNSGIANWVYSDDSEAYYWRALNERNTPKPAIAQAFADFFNIPCFGAQSGASIQVLHKGVWISSAAYKKSVGRWPGEPQILRLHPDRGAYVEYKPAGR